MASQICRLVALFALLSMAVTPAVVGQSPKTKAPRTSDPLMRADMSFSSFRLSRKTVPGKIGRLVNTGCDDESVLCEWQSKEGTRHILTAGIVAIKIVDAADMEGKPISALGIGVARRRGDVVARVRSFLPEIQINCLEAGDAGEGEGISSCGGAFASGPWFKLLFDRNGQLISARIDAFQID